METSGGAECRLALLSRPLDAIMAEAWQMLSGGIHPPPSLGDPPTPSFFLCLMTAQNPAPSQAGGRR